MLEFFSGDKSNIEYKNGRALWLFGIIKNSTKEFIIEVIFGRDAI